jgi:flagellin-like hook-associated protein FlgL
VTITVGTAASAFNPTTKAATVKTLDQLNTALAVAGVNLSGSITGPDDLTFTSTNDGAAQTITGTAAPTAPVTLDAINISANALGGGAGGAVVATVPDAVSQTARATLVSQYNQVIEQIKTTAQDASFNGINLLDGNSLKLIFNETGKSTLTIAGVSFDPNGLGLAPLAAGTDFIDNVLTGKVLTALNNASSTLRSQASAFGANLSIVQIRQDFAKNIINVLQTGSANLTLADSNEEAANSQALSTRQSIAVSALALANQSQQSVLKLLQ